VDIENLTICEDFIKERRFEVQRVRPNMVMESASVGKDLFGWAIFLLALSEVSNLHIQCLSQCI
jgi:hypothetical protein